MDDSCPHWLQALGMLLGFLTFVLFFGGLCLLFYLKG